MKFKCLLIFWMFSMVVRAQTPQPEGPLAADLQEEVVRITATVSDLYGRTETKPLPITVFRPKGEGPFPLVVYNHGRAVASKRDQQGRQRSEHLARYLVSKGFVVMMPTRIGYWETYAGGFDPEDSGNCNSRRVEPMSLAASDQVMATVAYAKSLPYVDTSRWVVMGVSVGGLTSIATVYRNPPGLVGGINFAGGSGGDPDSRPGEPCSPQALERLWHQKAPGATAPMLWLYWENDKFWGAEIPRKWHQAWTSGGAKAQMHTLAAIGNDGHSGVGIDMNHWVPLAEKFLADLGFAKSGVIPSPSASGFAQIDDAASAPTSKANQNGLYQKFLDAKSPRAFAIGKKGSVGYASGDWAMGKAIGYCQARRDDVCKIYAVDNEVVWVKD